MGFRLRKRIKILSGILLNLSKSGFSTSIGGKGLTLNIKDVKTKVTFGLPGTGLSYSETTSHIPSKIMPKLQKVSALFWLLVIVAIGLFVLLTK